MARPSDKAPFRRKEILDHFQQVLLEEGFEGASMAKIGKRMGKPPSLLLHYFSSKEEMIVELVDHILDQYETAFALKIMEIRDPSKRLETLLDTIFGIDWISIIDTRVFNACYYLSFRNSRVKERMQVMYVRFKEYLVRELQQCIDDGILPAGEVEKEADIIIAMVEGLNFYRNISGGKQKYRELGDYLKSKILNYITE